MPRTPTSDHETLLLSKIENLNILSWFLLLLLLCLFMFHTNKKKKEYIHIHYWFVYIDYY
jgi:hypothetical protein